MLEHVKAQIVTYVRDLDDSYTLGLYEKIAHGKMLRSKLVFAIAAGRADEKELFRLCAIIEMIHAASLLHDDVIDDATTRRGVPSINAAFGNKHAIMLGDILYSKAFYELVLFKDEVARMVSRAVTLLSVGELMDVELAKSFNTMEPQYMEMIYKKTASLIEASAYAAAVVAGLDAKAYQEYGKNLGLAFQIVDDLLDITSDSETLGKPALNDLQEGKTTLPYIRLYHKLGEQERKKLVTCHASENSEETISWIKEKFSEYGIVQECLHVARELGFEGIRAIESDRNQKLEEIMRSMIDREF